MYNNIGKKIKSWAKFIAYVGIGLSVLIGFVMIMEGCDSYYGGEALTGSGFLVLVVGSLSSWISSWFMYGFGELIERVTMISEGAAIVKSAPQSVNTPSSDSQKGRNYKEELKIMKDWKDSGLITEEEYQKKVANIVEHMSNQE